MRRTGDRVPDFDLATDRGDRVSSTSLRGRRFVLYFYPKDDTPGCTREACEFRDTQATIKKAGAVVFGISGDSIESHEKFKTKYKLNFPLLSDPGNEVATKFGAYGEKVLYGRKFMGIIRSTFIIDGDGVVRKVWARVKVDGHAEKVLEAIKAIAK